MISATIASKQMNRLTAQSLAENKLDPISIMKSIDYLQIIQIINYNPFFIQQNSQKIINSKMNTQQLKELHPLHLFIQEIKQPTLKIKSIKTATTIALALGDKKTREYLIPFLGALFHQQSQECQQAILQTLPTLIPYLGHSFYSYQLLEIVFDILCVYDEKQIKESAYLCLKKIISYIDIRRAQKLLCNTLIKLTEEKQIRFKQLIIRVIPQIYIAVSPDNQKQLIEMFVSYKNDEKDEVRIILANQLKELIKIMPPAPQSEIKQILEHFLKDKSQKVRIHMIDCLILLTQVLGEQSTIDYFKQIIQDTNSKVKSELYQKIVQLNQIFPEEVMMNLYLQIQNFNESEQEVKNKIISKLPILFQIYPAQIKQRFLTPLLKPSNSLQLKSTLAEVLCQMKDDQNLQILLAQGDNQFKLKVLTKIPILSRYSEMVGGMLKHKSWRVKLTILQNLQLRLNNPVQDFSKFFDIIIELLYDKVATIRKAAADLITKIILQKLKYPVQKLIKILQKIVQNDNWFVRYQALQIIAKLITNKQYLKLWQLVRKRITDKASGIRMMVVEIAKQAAKHGVKSCIEEVKILRNDQDSDVRNLFD